MEVHTHVVGFSEIYKLCIRFAPFEAQNVRSASSKMFGHLQDFPSISANAEFNANSFFISLMINYRLLEAATGFSLLLDSPC